jgi:hypothetical protein
MGHGKHFDLETGRIAYCSTCIYSRRGIKEKHLSRENLWREGLINLGGAGESFSVLPTWLIRWPRLLPGCCQAAASPIPRFYAFYNKGSLPGPIQPKNQREV